MTALLILVLLAPLNLCLAWRSFNFRFDSTECLKKNEMVDFLNCSIVKVKNNQEGFNMNLRFNKDIVKPQLDLLIINERQIENSFVLINITDINGCKFLENNEIFNILQIIRREFAKYSNLPNKCPVVKGIEISVNKMIIDSESFPTYVPATNFRVIVSLKESSDLMFILTIWGRVESKKRFGLFKIL